MSRDALYNVLIGACVICIMAVTVLLFTTKTSEPFTELYFENHQNLPKSVDVNSIYTFYYTIHNLENKPFTYHYNAYAEVDGERTVLKDFEVMLSHNQTYTRGQEFMISEDFKSAKIGVNILNKDQEIHFWVGQK